MWALLAAVLVIPQVSAPLSIEGELDETAWRSPARTGQFTDGAGHLAAPYSDARFLRDDHSLYLALYAADEDIRSSDEFVVELSSPRGHVTWHFTAGGAMTPAVAGAKVGIDLDGDLDHPANDDEEWIVEASIPIAAVPFGADGTVTAKVTRCDVTKDHVKRCGGWSGRLGRR